ncbi:GNAT family acetyltransferase [Novosphingobium fuchskuhlense]|uniref:GNAT family acetyltransferase n=1 Tax=Novosphingobium fuchskuhlense TaxID=1117702 RepID=A0A124JVZ6_9SPHN|nr:GNAT family N-acetyltransferase [Novosphingobium fuchskuhlense]KUR72812.1 GNAT family acetyltransferase [Novosphingobium fuchskuhlense]
MPDIIYRSYAKADEDAVIAHIVSIQQGEFAVPVTAADQPDLSAVAEVYQSGGGGFWVAELAGRIVGTIGLISYGANEGALRKMFVAADVRGREHGVAARLLELLVDHARAEGIVGVTLGTIERLHAAIRFYEKNGFVPVAPEDLPEGFPRMAVDTHFYRLELG